MLDNKNHQWPLVVSAERSRVTYFFALRYRNSMMFLVCPAGTLFLFPQPWGNRGTKKAVLWPPNKYSIPNAPLSCQSLSVNPHKFSRLPKLRPVILYNFPTCEGSIPVLYYNQKRKTGNKPEGSVIVTEKQRWLRSIKNLSTSRCSPLWEMIDDMCAE